MSNPMDINTFVPVSSFTLNSTGYTRCYANFENYSGPEGVIAIVWDDVKNMTANTINYIDEITKNEKLNKGWPSRTPLYGIHPICKSSVHGLESHAGCTYYLYVRTVLAAIRLGGQR